MWNRLLHDESGFIISSELILIATLLVLGLIVGLTEVQHAVVAELNDVADAIGSVNQSYWYSGFSKWSFNGGGIKAFTRGSFFFDTFDQCDNNQCTLDCSPPVMEGPKLWGGYGGGFGGGYGGGVCGAF